MTDLMERIAALEHERDALRGVLNNAKTTLEDAMGEWLGVSALRLPEYYRPMAQSLNEIAGLDEAVQS